VNKVIVYGRREAKLQEAMDKYPELITLVCDVTREADRIALFDWVTSEHPNVNVLINKADIQQRYHVLKTNAKEDWSYYSQEIAPTSRRHFTLPCYLRRTLPIRTMPLSLMYHPV
jgi:uncharacterized oxidoreductase